jgi:hypothetical protein
MPFQPGHKKAGGRKKGAKNLPPPVILSPDEAAMSRAMAIVAPSEVRTPKAVMLDAMMFFDRLARASAEVKDYAMAAKYMANAVQCADRVAPYIHARLIAMESREGASERVPYVVRAPAVMADSASWQAAVGAAVLEIEAAQVPSGGQPAVSGVSPASTAANRPIEPVSAPVALVADQKTGRVTVMPPGPRVVQPAGTVEWLDRVAAEKRRAGG